MLKTSTDPVGYFTDFTALKKSNKKGKKQMQTLLCVQASFRILWGPIAYSQGDKRDSQLKAQLQTQVQMCCK